MQRRVSCVDSHFCESLEMETFRTRDLVGALTFVGELNEMDSPEPFTTAPLDRLRELVPSEFVTYWAATSRQMWWCSASLY